jgi:hypothetical protein
LPVVAAAVYTKAVIGASDVLRRQWHDSGDRLWRRLQGLTDAEYFWEPAPSVWTVRPHASESGRWEIDYDWPPPDPPPLTTIAWRLVHLANGNWIYWEHAFGPGRRMFTDLVVPGHADDARGYWKDSRESISAWLDQVADNDLSEMRPSHQEAPRTAGEMIMILVDEQVHHGAEIALMRDLYRRLAP